MVTRDLMALRRYAQAEGWTFNRRVTVHGPITIDCREWHLDDLRLCAIVHNDGSVTASAWRRKPGTVDDPRYADIVHLPAATLAALIRVLVAVELLPRTWRAAVTPPPRVRPMAGQLELIQV